MDDYELLREYVTNHSQAAFAQVVVRHINHVYTTALRLVGDHALAQDVAQSVFVLLARRAAIFQQGGALGGWLYRVTYNRALSVLRTERRRRQRETAAMKIAALDEAAPSWEAVAPLLDEALAKLQSSEQNALALRFFEGKSLRETGAELGLSEDAAQKRIARALDKMRLHFARHGVTASAAILAALMAGHTAQAAPAGLATSVAGASFAAAEASRQGGLLSKIIFMSTKSKIVLAVAIVIFLALAITFVIHRPSGVSPALSSVAGTATTPPTAGASLSPVTPHVEAPKTSVVRPVDGPAAATAISKNRPDVPPGLSSAIAEIAALMQTGDTAGLMEKYMFPQMFAGMTPEMKAQMVQQAQRALLDPAQQQQQQIMGQVFQSLQGLTPAMSGAGNRATYVVPTPRGVAPPSSPPPGRPDLAGHVPDTISITFINIDGHWYPERAGL